MKVHQILLNELALPDTEGFWINPRLNKTVECIQPHVACVIQNAEDFNINLRQYGYMTYFNWEKPTEEYFDWLGKQDMQRSPIKMALYQRGWVRGWVFDFEDTMGISGFEQPVLAAGPFIIRLFSKKLKNGTLSIDIEDTKKHVTFNLPEQKQELYSFFGIQ